MTTCPTCGAESDEIYRCSECGKDLVDVQDDDDDPGTSPVVMTDGGQPADGGEQCENCNGTGMVGYSTPHYAGTAKCSDCDGKGVV